MNIFGIEIRILPKKRDNITDRPKVIQHERDPRITHLIEQEKKRHEKFIEYTRKSDAERMLRQSNANRIMFPHLQKATKRDYEKWLHGYLDLGNEPTHYYDYSFNSWEDEFYIATSNFETTELYGAGSIYIIVPTNIKWLGGGLGHNTLYFMDGFKKSRNAIVPIFSDVK